MAANALRQTAHLIAIVYLATMAIPANILANQVTMVSIALINVIARSMAAVM